MLADSEHRKRPSDHDSPGSRSSKKAKSMLGGPSTGEPDGDETTGANAIPDDDAQLEAFRKEAIWRQMQEYKRELARTQQKLDVSEFQKVDAEARLAAVDVCWNQLVEDVRLLFRATPPDSLPDDPFPVLTSSTSLDQVLAVRSAASKDLIVHLLSLASPASPDLDEVRARCRQLTSESASSRAALSLAESRLKQLQDQLEATEENLGRIEKRLDREKSKTVRLAEGRGQGAEAGSSSKVKQTSPDVPVKRENGYNEPQKAVKAKPDNEVSMALNGVAPAELESAQDLADGRLKELGELRDTLALRLQEIDGLKLKMSDPPADVVKECPLYKRLEGELGLAKAEAVKAVAALELVAAEANDLRERQDEFRTVVLAETNMQLEEMEKKLAIKDADCTRLRATREDIRAELHETKTREVEKLCAPDQVSILANSQHDRIIALTSEVRRLKMAAAADKGEKDLVEMYASEEGKLNRDLQERLKAAEQLALGLRDQLRNLTKSGGSSAEALIASEEAARQELLRVRERLEELEELIGPNGKAELREMAEKIQAKAEEAKVLEAKLKAQEGGATMLYAEVDRLSAAWATLDEQNRDKIFKLREQDEKLLKAVHEKAKADNKYFAAMRANEQLKSESAVLEKISQKQTATIEKLQDEARATTNRLTAAEKEVTLHQRAVNAHKSSLAALSASNEGLTARGVALEKQLEDLKTLLRERTAQMESEQRQRRRAEEGLARAEKELDKRRTQLEQVQKGTSESSQIADLKSYNDDLTKMLKCNSCKQRFKSHVITRCMHLFCGQCLDARIETRQRKCPSCQTGFGAQDVAAVYF